MDLEVAELPLDDEHAGLHLGVLERHIGQRLDVQSGSDLDDLRRPCAARGRLPRIQVASVHSVCG